MSRASLLENLEPRQHFTFGDVDPTFGTGGLAAGASGYEAADHLATFADGRVVVEAGAGTTNHKFLALYSASGVRSTTFAGDGTLDIEDDQGVIALATDNQNHVLVVVQQFQSTTSTSGLTVFRYTATGRLDTTYGNGGARTLPAPVDGNSSTSIVNTAPDGTIYVATTAAFDEGAATDDYSTTVDKITADGAIDTTWGDNGRVRLPSTSRKGLIARQATGLAIAADGKLLLTGTQLSYTLVSDPDSFGSDAVANRTEIFTTRLTTSGAVDPTFGDSGTTLLRVKPAGKIGVQTFSDMTAELAFVVGNRIQTALLAADGTFSRYVPTTTGAASVNRISQLLKLPDGRLVVNVLDQSGHSAVAPLTRDGGLGAFVQLAPAGFAYADREFSTAAVTADGKIIGAGRYIAEEDGHGAPTENTPTDVLVRLSVGTPGEARPDELVHAQQNSLAYGLDGSLHIAWYDAASKNLKYRERDRSGRWGDIATVDAAVSSGLYLSLAVAADGTVGVAYYDGTNGDLHYADKRIDGTFNTVVVDRKNSTGLYPSLKFSYDSRPYIAYFAGSVGDLRLASRSTSSTWSIETVDSAGSTGRHASLNIDPVRGTFAIAYAGDGTAVNFAERYKRGWKISRVATAVGGTDVIDLGFDYYGTRGSASGPAVPDKTTPLNVVIAYYDVSPADLVIARRKPGAKTFSRTTPVTSGATGLYPRIDVNVGVTAASAHRAFYWDRRYDNVRTAWDKGTAYVNDPIEPRTDAEVYASGGGRFLNFANIDLYPSGISQYEPSTLAYQDTASGNLFVRDV